MKDQQKKFIVEKVPNGFVVYEARYGNDPGEILGVATDCAGIGGVISDQYKHVDEQQDKTPITS